MKYLCRTLLFIPSFYFVTVARSQLITIAVEQQPLEKVLLLVEQQSGYNFIYSAEMMAIAKPVSVHASKEKLTAVLDACFKEQPLSYTISEKHVMVKVRPEEKITPYTLRGKVLGESGGPVAGVSIKVKGTTLVTATDAAGEFIVTGAPTSATLEVSGAEIEPLQIRAESGSYNLIRVKAKLNMLEEMVIKGYYQTSRKQNTGAVGKITAAQIGTQPVSNPVATLQGRITGLFVTQSSGLPGSQFSVQIRGRNSIQNGNEPLYVVDGVIFSSDNPSLRSGINVNSPFNTLPPGDIESIEVLKDADATALYGSRGANGVILITTKKGKQGKPSLQVGITKGWGSLARTMKYLDTRQYVDMRKEAFANDGLLPSPANAGDLLSWDTTRYTDWKKEIIGNSAGQVNADIRYTGGSELTRYSVSGNYYRETTVFPGDQADRRLALMMSLQTRSADNRLNFSLSANYAQELNQLSNRDLTSTLLLPPNSPPLKDAVGNLQWQENGVTFDNPLGVARRMYRAAINRLTASSMISYTPFNHFLLRLTGGINRQHLNEKTSVPLAAQNPATAPKGAASFGTSDQNAWIAEMQGEYTAGLGDRLRLKALFGASWQSSQAESALQAGSGYISDMLLGTIAGAASVSASDNYTKYRYQALYARIEFDYRDKWILNLTGRRDGSSRFGPGRRYANFGAGGLAWLFFQESWLKNSKWLSYGKLRTSYGLTGNDQIGNYQYFDLYSTTRFPFLSQPGLQPTRLFNPAYSWEQKSNMDLAVELGFLKNRVMLNVTWFRSQSGNQIIQYTLPGQTGFTGILRNFPGLVENRGWEWELTTRNIARPKFTWSTSFNLTVARNKLLKFPGLESSSYNSSYVIGEPLSIRFLYDYTGVDKVTGLYSFTDVNRDGSIDYLDRTIIRNTDPKFYGGLLNSVGFSNFEVSLFFQFVKQDGVEAIMGSFFPVGFQRNVPVDVLDRWQKPGDIARYQRFTATTGEAYNAANSVGNSTAILTDASYIRLKTVSVTYNLPQAVLKRLHAGGASIFVQAQNLFTFTSYRGPDPENQSVTAIPPLRMITIGARLTF